MYVIETRNERNRQWTDDGLGLPDANRFASEDDAESAIDELRQLGDDWAAAEYRVVER